jgi:Flp pilus assembly protein TadG
MFDPAIAPFPPPRRFAAALLADRRGASAVELALLLPTLVAFMIGVVDVGALSYEQMQVIGAAHAGALYALHNASGGACPSTSGVTAAVTGSTGLTVTATPAPACYKGCVSGGAVIAPTGATCTGGGTPYYYVQVNAQASVTPVIAWANLVTPTTLSSVAVVRIQ